MLYPSRQSRQIAGQFPILGRGNPVVRGYPRLNRNDPINRGLVGYWSMDYPTLKGVSLADISGNGNTGTLVASPPLTTGRIGQALLLDGSTQYVSFASINKIGMVAATSEVTICAWIKTTSAFGIIFNARSADGSAILSLVVGRNGAAAQDGKLGTLVRDNNGDGLTNLFSSSLVNDGIYHLVALTITSAKVMQLFIDGKPNGSTATHGMGVGITPAAADTCIGYDPINSSLGKISGPLDDMRFQTRALSPVEIYRLYSDTTGQLGMIVPRRPIVGSSAPGVSAPSSLMVWS